MRTLHHLRRSTVRAIAVAGIAAVLLSAAACGDDADPAADGDVELRFSWWGNADRAAATQRVIDAFQASHPKIKVKGETTEFTAYFDKLATEVAAGSAPDVITLGGAYPREYGDRGALLDLKKVGGELKTDKIGEAALGNGNFDDTQYGVPTGVNAISLVLNPDLFAQAGVPVPDTDTWTWDDFKATATQLAGKLPDGTYAVADPTRTDMLDVWSRQRGEGLFTPDGKVGIGAGTLTEWFTFTASLLDAKITPPAATTAESQGQPAPEQSLMGRGKAAMGFDWSNLAGALRKASGTKLELHRVPGETGGTQPGQWLQASQLYTINARSEHPKEAAQFVDFLVNSPEAGKIILTDRGVPANSEVRAAIVSTLEEDQSVQVEYIDKLTPKAGPPLVIGPSGSADAWRILDRVNVDVLFKRKTPADGAADFIRQLEAAVR